MNVTVREVLAAIRARTASLVAETAGYLVLATADQIASAPRIALFEHIKLESDGSLRVLGGLPAESAEAERSLRRLLAELMLAAGSATPALVRASKRESGSGIEQLIRELEAALIPVNRAAGRRALSRLHRETARAPAMLDVAPKAPLLIQAARLDVAAAPHDVVRNVAEDVDAAALPDLAAAVSEPVLIRDARPDPAPPAPRPAAVREPTPPLAAVAAVDEAPLSVASALALPTVETRPPPTPVPDASLLAPAATAVDGIGVRTSEPAVVEPSWDSSRVETVAPFAVETVAVAPVPPARAALAAVAIGDVPAAVFVPSAESEAATTCASSVAEPPPLSSQELEPLTHPEPVVVRRRAERGEKRTPPFGTFAGYEPSAHGLALLSPDDVTERMPAALDPFEEQEHELDCAENIGSPEIALGTELLPVSCNVVEPAAALVVDLVVSDAFDVVEIEPNVPEVDVDVDLEIDADSQSVDEGAALAAAEPIATSASMACEAVNEPTPSEAASESIVSETLSEPVAVVVSEPLAFDVLSEPVAVEVVSEAVPSEAVPESVVEEAADTGVNAPAVAPGSASRASTEALGREELAQSDDASIDSCVGAESASVDEGSGARPDDAAAEATVGEVLESRAAAMELASALAIAEMDWMTFVAVAPIEAALLLTPSLAEDAAAADEAAAPIEAALVRSPSPQEQDDAPIEAAAPGAATEAAVAVLLGEAMAPVATGEVAAPVAMGESEAGELPAEDIDLSDLEESASHEDSTYRSEQQPSASDDAGELDVAQACDSIAEAPLANILAAQPLVLDESLVDVPAAEVVPADEPVADVEVAGDEPVADVRVTADESLAARVAAQWADSDESLADVPAAQVMAADESVADVEAVSGELLAEVRAAEAVAADEPALDVEVAADESLAELLGAQWAINDDQLVDVPPVEAVAAVEPLADAEPPSDAESPLVEVCAVEVAPEDAPLAEIPAVESAAVDELLADPEAAAEALGFDASVANAQEAAQWIAPDEFFSDAEPVAELVDFDVSFPAVEAAAEAVSFDESCAAPEAAADQRIAQVSAVDVEIGRAWLSPEPPPSLGRTDEMLGAEVQSGLASFDQQDAAEPLFESDELRNERGIFEDREAEQLCDWFALQREWASLDEDGAAVPVFEPGELQSDAASFDQYGAPEELFEPIELQRAGASFDYYGAAEELFEPVTVDGEPPGQQCRYAEQPLESLEVDELDEGNLPVPTAWPRVLPRLELVISAEPPAVIDVAAEGELAEPAISAEPEAAVDAAGEGEPNERVVTAEPPSIMDLASGSAEPSERPPIGDFADRAAEASDQSADQIAFDAAFWTIDSERAEGEALPSLSSIDAGWPEVADSVNLPASAFCSDDAEPAAEIERESGWLGESDILDVRAELVGVEAPPLRESDPVLAVISNESLERVLPDVEPCSPDPLAAAALRADCRTLASAGAALRADCPTPPKSPPTHPSAPELAPPRFTARQSDVEELLAGFATSATRSDRELCKDLQSLAGIGLTPLPPGFE